jgi:branched-chain amino acid transport system permease protein
MAARSVLVSLRPWAAPAFLVAVLVAIPAALSLIGLGYPFRIAQLTMIFVILSASLNLVSGTAGLLSLGHAAFYGVGAYTTALLATNFQTGFLVNVLASYLVAGVLGFIVALPTIRLVRIFFAVATLSVGEIITLVIVNWYDLTRGPMGIREIPAFGFAGIDLSGALPTYYIIGVTMLACLWVIHRLTHSYYGNALRALREDDQAAGAMGLNVGLMKLVVFGISTGFAGVAGALLAHATNFISPDMFRLTESILILTMVVVGGLGSLPGAIVGAVILIVLPELGRDFGQLRMVVVGTVLFLSILLMPRGIVGEVSALDLLRARVARPGARP